MIRSLITYLHRRACATTTGNIAKIVSPLVSDDDEEPTKKRKPRPRYLQQLKYVMPDLRDHITNENFSRYENGHSVLSVVYNRNTLISVRLRTKIDQNLSIDHGDRLSYDIDSWDTVKFDSKGDAGIRDAIMELPDFKSFDAMVMESLNLKDLQRLRAKYRALGGYKMGIYHMSGTVYHWMAEKWKKELGNDAGNRDQMPVFMIEFQLMAELFSYNWLDIARRLPSGLSVDAKGISAAEASALALRVQYPPELQKYFDDLKIDAKDYDARSVAEAIVRAVAFSRLWQQVVDARKTSRLEKEEKKKEKVA